jgi:hypothetical protein
LKLGINERADHRGDQALNESLGAISRPLSSPSTEMEKELLDTLEASDCLLKFLNRELETLNDNYAKAGLNPKTSQRLLRMTVLETAQTMLNTVKPRPEGRALIDSVLMKWVFESVEGK